MSQVNPHMANPFQRYSAPKLPSRLITPTCLAHQIVYAESEDKYVQVFYLDNAQVLRSFLLGGKNSLKNMELLHGDGFKRISRKHIINTDMVIDVFPISPTQMAVGLGTDPVKNVCHLPLAKSQLKAVKALVKEKH